MPSGPACTSRRNTSSRLSWASAARAATAWSFFIFQHLLKYYPMSRNISIVAEITRISPAPLIHSYLNVPKHYETRAATGKRSFLFAAVSREFGDRPLGAAFPEKVCVHNPSLARLRLSAHVFDIPRQLAKISGHEDFVVGAEISAPEDVDLGIADCLERAIRVQHHDHVVDVVRQSLGDFAARRDVNRAPDPVERDFVPRRQCLDGADAGNDFVLERHCASGNDLIDDPQGTVVERWIAPDQKGTALVFAEFLPDQSFVDRRPLFMPCAHGRFIRRRFAIPWRIGRLNSPVGLVFDVSFANLLSQTDEFVGVLPFVHDEEYVDLIKRIDGLYRDVFGVACADANDENLSHGSCPATMLACELRIRDVARQHQRSLNVQHRIRRVPTAGSRFSQTILACFWLFGASPDECAFGHAAKLAAARTWPMPASESSFASAVGLFAPRNVRNKKSREINA